MDRFFETYNVYFSYPYDLDWIMLNSFPTSYHSFIPDNGGPKILPKTDAQYIDKTKNAIASVLKKDAEDIDIDSFEDHEEYYWYRYLFLGRGKPLSHNYVLKKLDNDSLKNNAPDVLKNLIEKVRGLL